MARWIQWYLLTRLTGSPIGSLLALIVIWWLGDRFTFQLLPDPLRLVARWRRRGELRETLATNPHDRRARFELAELLLEGHRAGQAVEVLRPNIEAGDDDVHTAFVMGAALARSGAYDQAERVLAVARQTEPSFRAGEIDLELGRMLLARGDHAGAREALERLLAIRPGTVEGRFYLAQTLAGLGDLEGAKRARQEAWREYASLPRFRRKQERSFAWRIKPWRPAAVLVAAILVAALAAYLVLPAVTAAMSSRGNASPPVGAAPQLDEDKNGPPASPGPGQPRPEKAIGDLNGRSGGGVERGDEGEGSKLPDLGGTKHESVALANAPRSSRDGGHFGILGTDRMKEGASTASQGSGAVRDQPRPSGLNVSDRRSVSRCERGSTMTSTYGKILAAALAVSIVTPAATTSS